jgi:hypothetical protein
VAVSRDDVPRASSVSNSNAAGPSARANAVRLIPAPLLLPASPVTVSCAPTTQRPDDPNHLLLTYPAGVGDAIFHFPTRPPSG